MIKKDLVKVVAAKTGIPQAKTAEMIDAVVESIMEGAKEDGVVIFTGFGKFVVQDIPERPAMNLQTGSQIIVPAHKRVRFKVGKDFKEFVNE